MRKSTTLFFLCLSCLTLAAARSPFDFSTTLPDGQTLYFRIGGDNASVDTVVTLVAPSAGSGNGWEGFQAPAGELTIPARVSFDYVEYKVRYIDRKAFAGCTQLTGVVLPETMYQVGDSAFFGCSGLEQVKLAESAGSMAEIDYGNAVFAESGIRSFDFRGVRTVGEQMFFNCRQLEKVEGEVYPLREMFAGCTSLRSFVFPRQTYELQDGVLRGCTALRSLKLQDVLPPKIGSNSLDGVPADLILTVPCGTIDDYRESEWSVFSNIQEDVIPFVIEIAYDTIQGMVVVSEETLDCADRTVTITAIAKHGYAFDRWSDGSTDNPREITIAETVGLRAIFKIVEDGPDHGTTTPPTPTEFHTSIKNHYLTITVDNNYSTRVYIYNSRTNKRVLERIFVKNTTIQLPRGQYYYVLKCENLTLHGQVTIRPLPRPFTRFGRVILIHKKH